MADYVGVAHTNALKVKDEKAFLEWVDTLPGVVTYPDTHPGTLVLLAGGTGGTGESRMRSTNA